MHMPPGHTTVRSVCQDRVCVAQVQGQTADLTDLQRILLRSEQKLSDAQQQNMTVGQMALSLLLLLTHE